MLLTDSASIRDVILFPLLKPRRVSEPTSMASQAGPALAPSPGPGAGHPAPPVFHWRSFLVVLVGVARRGGAGPGGERVPRRSALAARAAATGSPRCGGHPRGGPGRLAGWRFRRMAFYEIAATALLWVALAAGLASLGARGGAARPGRSGLAGDAGAGAGAARARGAGSHRPPAIGTSLAFLLAGSGRLDVSFSYELLRGPQPPPAHPPDAGLALRHRGDRRGAGRSWWAWSGRTWRDAAERRASSAASW